MNCLRPVFVCLFLLLVGLSEACLGQGSWKPQLADTATPRVWLRRDKIQSMRDLIRAHSHYGDIYQSAVQNLRAELDLPADEDLGTQQIRTAAAQNAALAILVGFYRDTLGVWQNYTQLDKDTLADKAIQVMVTYNNDVPLMTFANPSAYDGWQWKSKFLIYLVCAYDILRAAGVSETKLAPAREKVAEFAANLYKATVTDLTPGFGFFSIAVNNHVLMTCGAYGLAAVVLNDYEHPEPARQPVRWLNTALYHIDNVLWRADLRQSERGQLVGYAESPYYMRYGLQNCWPFFRALSHFLPDGVLKVGYKSDSVNVRHPWHDPDYLLLAEWQKRIRLPDGRMPPIDDTYMAVDAVDLALLGLKEYHWPIDFSRRRDGQARNWSQAMYSALDFRAHYLAAQTPMKQNFDDEDLFQALPQSGNLVFRSGWGAQSIYAHVTAENGRPRSSAFGHNHGDAASFLLYGLGEIMALDAAYVRYNVREKYGQPSNHNLILVDDCGPAIGGTIDAADADAYIDQPVDLPACDYARVTTRYCDADVERRFSLVDQNYFVTADFARSATPRKFTFQLHGNGLQNGADSIGFYKPRYFVEKGVWTRNGVSLLSHITALGGVSKFRTETNYHEVQLGVDEPHSVLLADKSNATEALFLSVHQIYPENNPVPQVETLEADGLAALRIDGNLYALAQLDTQTVVLPQNLTHLSDHLNTDARFVLVAPDTLGRMRRLFLSDGTTLNFGNHVCLSASPRMTAGLEKVNAELFKGYAQKKGKIIFYFNQTPKKITGDSLTNWDYDAQTHTLTLWTFGETYFKIESVYAPVSRNDDQAQPWRFLLFPNPASRSLNLRLASQWEGETELQMLTPTGQKVWEKTWRTDGLTLSIDVATLPAGLYFVQMKTNDGVFTQKFQKN